MSQSGADAPSAENFISVLNETEQALLDEIVTRFDSILTEKGGFHMSEVTGICLVSQNNPSYDYNYIGERAKDGSGKREGFGLAECLLTGKQQVGMFSNDELQFGVVVYQDGTCYMGNFKGDQKSGAGLSLAPDKTFFFGEWLNGKMDG